MLMRTKIEIEINFQYKEYLKKERKFVKIL